MNEWLAWLPSVLSKRDQQLLRVVDRTTSDVPAACGTRRVFPPIPDTLGFLAFCPRFKISRHLRPVHWAIALPRRKPSRRNTPDSHCGWYNYWGQVTTCRSSTGFIAIPNTLLTPVPMA